MQKKRYVGKYCSAGKRRRRGMCRALYAIHFLILLIAAVRIISLAGEETPAEEGMFVSAGATTVESPAWNASRTDTLAPEIAGVKDLMVYQGDAVAYRSGITVTDDTDPQPKLEVDSSRVDLSRPGTYNVTYRASDASGNQSEAMAAVTVLPKQADFVELTTIYESADAALGVIITDDMTTREQVEAIYNWSRKSCRYSGHSDRTDWRQTAYTMLTTGTGDCFGFYSVTKLLFERLGIPNIDVVKVKNYDGDSEHFWSLVSVDGGESYYHFDATPRRGQVTALCLVTDELLDSFSQRNSGSHNRDTSLYPATPEV